MSNKENQNQGYREQNGCHNCKKCFVKFEYAAGPEYFCTKDAPQRPPCACNETFGDVTANEYERLWDAAYEAWENWSKDRERKAWGICEDWGDNG